MAARGRFGFRRPMAAEIRRPVPLRRVSLKDEGREAPPMAARGRFGFRRPMAAEIRRPVPLRRVSLRPRAVPLRRPGCPPLQQARPASAHRCSPWLRVDAALPAAPGPAAASRFLQGLRVHLRGGVAAPSVFAWASAGPGALFRGRGRRPCLVALRAPGGRPLAPPTCSAGALRDPAPLLLLKNEKQLDCASPGKPCTATFSGNAAARD